MSHIIRPTDFNKNTADKNRNRWTAGQLRHVIAAIKTTGATTLVETTEGLLQEYTPVDLLPTRGFHGYDLVLRHTYTENGVEKHQDIRFASFKIGAIIVLNEDPTTKDARNIAITTYSEETSGLVRTAQAEHGESEGRAWGKWDATPGAYDRTGHVTYTPHTGNPGFADQWGTPWHGSVTVAHCDEDGETCTLVKHHYGYCKPMYVEA